VYSCSLRTRCLNRSTALAEVRPWKGAVAASAEVRLRKTQLLVDLSQSMKISSPFFVDLLKWRVELCGLLRRLAADLSRPVMMYENDEAEIIYPHRAELSVTEARRE